jgi:general secretion pathway protein D
VAAAVSALRSFDQPVFAGAKVARFEPAFWSAEGFAKALRDALSAEGYKLADTILAPRTIMVLPMNANGQVLVFTADQQLMDRVLFWASQLDRAATIGDQKSTFIYTVRNTDASSLVGLVTGTATQQQSTVQSPVGVAGTPPASASGASQNTVGAGGTVPGGGAITSDIIGNRLIFSGTAAQFAQVRSLLEQLDVAPAQVLVEVTIAEVTLTDQTRAGLEIFFNNSLGGTSSISGGTKGGLGIGTGGFNLTYVGANMNVAFNAFASNNKVNILSRPRLMARSGTDAQLQVGSDIPIITSQQASTVQTAGSTSVLQSVSYRQTGIILKLKPVVYGDRVDMTISQEVSSQQSNGNAAISSPVILNRSVTTQLSVPDGATGVISGLIDNSYSKGNEGIPFAKDVPIFGQLFRTDTVDGSKTDLLILVTPHIVRTDDDIANLTDRLSGEINNSFRVGRGSSYTLTSFATGQSVGIALPPVRPIDVLTKTRSRAGSAKPASPPVQP